MYKKIHFYIIFLFSLLFGHSANACGGACGSNSCEPSSIRSQLVYLGLSPTITNNKELLDDIELEYGQSFMQTLVKEHKSLSKKPRGKIDKKTLKWIEKKGFKDTFSPGVRYVFSPFITSKNEFGSNVFLKTLLLEIYPVFKGRPAFFSHEQLDELKKEFTQYNYVKIILYLKSSFGLTEKQALKVSIELYNKIFEDRNYIIGEDLKKIEGHTVIVAGYSKPGSNEIFDNKVTLSFTDVIEIFKDSISANVNFDLKHDHAGFGKVTEIKTSKSKEELKQLFVHSNIKVILGNINESYAYKFSEAIYSTWPEFKGNVIAYNGEVILELKNKGYFRDPADKNKLIFGETNSVSLTDKTNKFINFDKSEMRVIYKKEQFSAK